MSNFFGMFSEQLKISTKLAHQSLEKIIVQRIRLVQTPADYKKLLQCFYGFYNPMEHELDPFFSDSTIIPQF